MKRAGPTFDEPRLARACELLTPEEIHALPFGAIRLDAGGNVIFYSDAEATLSGRGERPVLGHHFFTEIAPCMGTPAFRGRIERAAAAGSIDIEFGHVGDFDDDSKEIRVRVQSATGGGLWIFMARD